jgi:lipopolysaccharide transport system ATP-binding protein
MSDSAIRVEKLGKLYRIGSRTNGYETLRDTLAKVFSAPFRGRSNCSTLTSTLTSPSSLPADHVWALNDVSFEVKRGEVVGIIGRNGAGKSTLLKILSRITEPTEGYAEIRGRVGSLLEVGTGFHPELTGRENIILNGAILGMRKREIERKFDEIVAFAEIEKFIDTPVKHYSSGMYVRLAFAVAAYLDPEILLIDEVLAVGDLAFQKKCLGRMGDVAKGGRTVIFVSHQMNQIRRLCERVAWLDSGGLRRIGSCANVIGLYESAMSSLSLNPRRAIAEGHVAAQFVKWEIAEPRNTQSNLITGTESVTIKFIVKVLKSIKNVCHGIALFSSDNQLIWANAANGIKLEPGTWHFSHHVSSLPVRPGVYYWQVSLHDDNGLIDFWNGFPEMVVATKSTGHPLDVWQGVLNLPWNFSLRQEQQ